MNSPMVFSVRPAYVAMFRRGIKRYEYRTRMPSVRRGEMALLYETAPVSMIVAEVTIGALLDRAPDHLWWMTQDGAGITREEFDRYFACRSRAVAIGMTPDWLPKPVPLPPGMAAPQSWARYKGEWRP